MDVIGGDACCGFGGEESAASSANGSAGVFVGDCDCGGEAAIGSTYCGVGVGVGVDTGEACCCVHVGGGIGDECGGGRSPGSTMPAWHAATICKATATCSRVTTSDDADAWGVLALW